MDIHLLPGAEAVAAGMSQAKVPPGQQPEELAAEEQKVVLVQRRELDRDLDLTGTRSGRLRDIDDVHYVFWSSELGDLDGTHTDSR